MFVLIGNMVLRMLRDAVSQDYSGGVGNCVRGGGCGKKYVVERETGCNVI